jgi:sugar transferase (PEP-CTERM/EpsH1 system associated)
MSEVLFLAHRIPYPPNKGDKIRSWRWLEGLAERGRVHLGAFIDDSQDWQYVSHLEKLCASCHFEALPSTVAHLRALRGALSGRSLTEGIYSSSGMRRFVSSTVASAPLDAAFGFSSGMAPMLLNLVPPRIRRVLDLCDVDSDKWRQFAANGNFPMSWVYEFEHRRLALAERDWVGSFDALLVVSAGERALLERVAGARSNVFVVGNGVDSVYFDPGMRHPNPYQADTLPVVFTGAMNYGANVEAVEWFVGEVLPRIRASEPRVVFTIVGANPVDRVTRLAAQPGVIVTGTVPDVRPFVQHARCVAVPLRIARGIQNKLLEAMAMSKPIVATPEAVAGLGPHVPHETIDVQSDANAFAQAVVRRVGQQLPATNVRGREYVLAHYDWRIATRDFLEQVLPAGLPADSIAAGTG